MDVAPTVGESEAAPSAAPEVAVSEFLSQLLQVARPLSALTLPLLDAHGATIAQDIYVEDRKVLAAGTKIRSVHVGLAASLGLDSLPTRPQPRVVVISAGKDLAAPGQDLPEGKEFEVNSWLLATAAKEAGALAYRVAVSANLGQLAEVISDQLVRADLIVLTGESHDQSFSELFNVARSLAPDDELAAFQPKIENTGLHAVGVIGPERTPVLIVPGDAIAAYLSSELFLRPAIKTMMGSATIYRSIVKAKIDSDLLSPIGVTSMVRAQIRSENGLVAHPLADQDDLATLAAAQGLIVIGSDSSGYQAGDQVELMLLERAN